jgi:hypothetical protein
MIRKLFLGKFFPTLVLTMVWGFMQSSCVAETFRVDDSASLPSESATNMRWKSLAPSRSASNLVDGATIVTVRLNLAAWRNRNGKIYLALPALPIGQVNAAWSTQGRLLPGELVSGNRTLVYSGNIKTNVLEDTLALKLQTDGRRLASPQRLQFHFEIDAE